MDAPNTNCKNRTVFTGDNLDMMRGMNSESVDLIYADPPFNSNKNYAAPIGSEAAGAAFKDTWTLSDIDVAWLGIVADKHPGVYKVVEAAGVTHGKGMQSYLCMMGIRLIEMRRLLKPTGSIYLHCDPTASHYLKILMDAVFGLQRFRNEIVWKRFNFHADARRFGVISDRILFYSAGDSFRFNCVRVSYSKQYIESKFTHHDRDGRRFRLSDLNPPSGRGPVYDFHGVTRAWRLTEEKMRQLDSEGRIYTDSMVPQLKRYLDEMPGQAVADIWTDVPAINSQAKERTGYPTQKPLALLERIIAASSNPDDVVLDPFCGCATALIAAEKLTRKWVGIDISEMAVRLVRHRLYREVPLFTQDAIDRSDVPRRTDLVDEVREYQNDKHVLYGQQEGHCNGCGGTFEFRNLEVDHVVPRAKGGADHISNYQLLCGFCNRTKGTGSQAELLAKLMRDGIVAA